MSNSPEAIVYPEAMAGVTLSILSQPMHSVGF
jgi:hypothetical protein